MSYERYKDYRLAPDDNGCWDVLNSDYVNKGTYPSKAAAKRAIDELVNMSTDNEEDELDALLLEARTDEYGDSGNYYEAKLKRLIKLRDQQIALDARLDELQLTKDNHPITGGFHADCNICKAIDERMSALKSKEEK
jgi:hypothetical protein